LFNIKYNSKIFEIERRRYKVATLKNSFLNLTEYFTYRQERSCLKCKFQEHLRQHFHYEFTKITREKEKASKRGENEYDKKRIVKILVLKFVFSCEE